MTAERDAWLKLTEEEALEPELPILDPHHHLWDKPADRYMIDEVTGDFASGHNVVQTVFVECDSMYRASGLEEMRSVGEVEFVRGIAAQGDSGLYGPTRLAAGIVGYADLGLGAAVEPVLEALDQASSGRFRGIRYTCSWDENPELRSPRMAGPGMLSDPKFRQGFDVLQRRGHGFDALVYHHQLLELVDLANAFPGAVIILNHIGRPLGLGPYAGRRDEVFQAWQRDMTAMAACPNVVVKVGGLGNRISGFGWDTQPKPPDSAELVQATAPYYRHTIEAFGPERCMFESNFPVDKNSYSYTAVWNSFKIMTQDFTAAERTLLFHDAAAKAYRLPLLSELQPAIKD
ncbi:MAG: amidohydrolase family protein [Chloroflexi bacterium]|nr:amidohydrolase family protein [Chloroflexota bacterium]MDA1270501.1 amidohydrolase family protein [Chloroflexota bacterium]PKB59684.1 MAG: amidohydrolase [SAR202 cluster bacterium Casp-Chloro-G2]